MATQETEQAKGKGQAARNAAVKKLVEEFGERFTELHNEERKARGLFPITKKQSKDDLHKEIERLRALAQEHGINPDA